MEESSLPVDSDRFCCSVCLALFSNPVTVPCGHSFCMDCIRHWWDQEDRVDGTGNYSCPQCQLTFKPRPALGKNILLAEMVEKKKQSGHRPDPGPGTEGVWCDVCPRGAQLALKSCLRCLASYCEAHLRPHYESPALQRHQLTEATGSIRETVCTLHEEPLNVYCRTDQCCICVLCMTDEHRLHDTVSAAAERAERQKSLGTAQENFQKWIQEREKELQDMRRGVDLLTSTAQRAVAESERLFEDILQSIVKQRLKVKELILTEERAAVACSKGQQERLEQEILELKRRDSELQKLAQTEDHTRFLQCWKSLSAPPGYCTAPRVIANPRLTFASVNKVVSKLRDRLVPLWQAEFEKMSGEVSRVNKVASLPSRKHRAKSKDPLSTAALAILKPQETGSGCGPPAIKVQVLESPVSLPEPRTREDFLRYACKLTLDPDTAHAKLLLSAGNRKVTWVKDRQSYPNNPGRFDYKCQVLSREALSGRRYYWEAEVKGNKVEIAVAYNGIKRKGGDRASSFGGNDQSWSLDCINGVYSVCHNNIGLQLAGPYCSRVGVYLDHPAGKLSFYRVSDAMTLLDSFTSVFTEPVYAGFWMGEKCAVELLALVPSS